jgi:uncharacterized membrane protein YccC
MRVSDQSAKALAGLAVIFLVPGVLIESPTGRFFCVLLAAIIALIPLVLGSTKRRVYAGVVLAISLLIGVATYPDFQTDYDTYVERARQKGKSPPSQSAPSNAPTSGQKE